MINIYYLQHRRNFLPILFYFLNRIKPENKKKITLFLLNTIPNITPLELIPKDINIEILTFNSFGNYKEKFLFALQQDVEYFFKLDEDIIFSEHVWNYMIENAEIVSQPDVLTLSPTINIGVPSVDLFIEYFCPQQKQYIEELFLKTDLQKTAGDRWGINIEKLNDHTIRASKWKPFKFHESLKTIESDLKGIHPIRFTYEAQNYMMNIVLNDINKFISNKDFEIRELNCPYLVNDLCLYETQKIRQVAKEFNIDPYDEIPMNLYGQKYNLKHLYIGGGFALHSYFAFVSRYDSSKHEKMYQEEHYIHNTILNKSKEIHHFDL